MKLFWPSAGLHLEETPDDPHRTTCAQVMINRRSVHDGHTEWSALQKHLALCCCWPLGEVGSYRVSTAHGVRPASRISSPVQTVLSLT